MSLNEYIKIWNSAWCSVLLAVIIIFNINTSHLNFICLLINAILEHKLQKSKVCIIIIIPDRAFSHKGPIGIKYYKNSWVTIYSFLSKMVYS